MSFLHKRIVVIGTTGSGKSMLGERLGARLGLEYIDLDALFWKPNWIEIAREEFRARVETATRTPGWVVAGNYRSVRDILWPRAEAVIWLDYPFLVIFVQLWRRTWRRWRSKELLWGTNYERFWPQLKLWSKDSLFNWLLQTYWRRKREFPVLFAQPEYQHLSIYRFKSPRETEEWFQQLTLHRKEYT